MIVPYIAKVNSSSNYLKIDFEQFFPSYKAVTTEINDECSFWIRHEVSCLNSCQTFMKNHLGEGFDLDVKLPNSSSTFAEKFCQIAVDFEPSTLAVGALFNCDVISKKVQMANISRISDHYSKQAIKCLRKSATLYIIKR